MDYRNLPFKFGYNGINLIDPPEALPEGQFTKFQNVRYRRGGTLEARPGTENFASTFLPLVGGPGSPIGSNIDVVNTIDVGPLLKTHYAGKIFSSGSETDGWVFFYTGKQGSSNAQDYRVFLNFGVVFEAESGCFTAYTTASPPPAFKPNGYSVVRTTSPNGRPILILDGSHYLYLRECDLYAAPFTLDTYVFINPTAPGNPTEDGGTIQDLAMFPAYKLGITAPAAPGSINVASAGNITAGNYYWRATYYSTRTGFESPAGTATAETAVASGKQASMTVARSTDPQVDAIRLYRKGNTISSWRLTSTTTYNICVGSGAVTVTDNSADSTIALNQALDTDLVAPFSTINQSGTAVTAQEFNQCWGPFLGKYHFWVGDPVKKGNVYWNKSGDAARYNSLDNVNSVTDPGEALQNGFIFSAYPFVFSKLNLYALDYGGPDATPEFTPRLIPIGLGLAGKWAFAVGPNAVYFMGRDGIYATDCQPGDPVSLTETTLKPLFQGVTRGGLSPIDWTKTNTCRMAVSPKELHFFYTGIDNSRYHLVFDLIRGGWSSWTKDVYSNAYVDEGAAANRIVFGHKTNVGAYSIDDTRPSSGTETFTVLARTGSVDNGIPLTFKEYGVLQLDADLAATSVTVTPYYNSEVTAGTALTYQPDTLNEGRKDYSGSLSDTYGRSVAFEFTWQETPSSHPILYQGNLLFREDEEQIIHWETPPTSLGNGGWYHLKDADFAIRSTTDVTLTVVIDNTYTDTYTLTSTSGARLKRYVEFKPRRGKVFQFKLDSVAAVSPLLNKSPFRFYGEESVLRGKPWVTGATYQSFSPFGAAGYAEYRRTEGGT